MKVDETIILNKVINGKTLKFKVKEIFFKDKIKITFDDMIGNAIFYSGSSYTYGFSYSEYFGEIDLSSVSIDKNSGCIGNIKVTKTFKNKIAPIIKFLNKDWKIITDEAVRDIVYGNLNIKFYRNTSKDTFKVSIGNRADDREKSLIEKYIKDLYIEDIAIGAFKYLNHKLYNDDIYKELLKLQNKLGIIEQYLFNVEKDKTGKVISYCIKLKNLLAKGELNYNIFDIDGKRYFFKGIGQVVKISKNKELMFSNGIWIDQNNKFVIEATNKELNDIIKVYTKNYSLA